MTLYTSEHMQRWHNHRLRRVTWEYLFFHRALNLIIKFSSLNLLINISDIVLLIINFRKICTYFVVFNYKSKYHSKACKKPYVKFHSRETYKVYGWYMKNCGGRKYKIFSAHKIKIFTLYFRVYQDSMQTYFNVIRELLMCPNLVSCV